MAAPNPTPTTSKASDQAKSPVEADVGAAKAAPVVELKEGAKARLRAVHGLIINPNNEIRFNTEDSKLVVVDTWTAIQFAAGKLAISEE